MLINKQKPIIKCIYIETDDLRVCDSYFDLENVRYLLDKNNIDSSFYELPDKETEKVKVKRPRINQRGNWDWIENGKPRPWKK